MNRIKLWLFTSLIAATAFGQAKTDWNQLAEKMSSALITHFWGASFPGHADRYYFNYLSDMHHMGTEHYWPEAHAMDVITDAYLRSGDERYAQIYPLWWEGAPKYNMKESHNEADGWWNPYIDDMEWIILAQIRMSEASGEVKYLEKACQMFDDYVWPTWGPEDESPWFGGLTWNIRVKKSKNACSNGPAGIIAARLYQNYDRFPNPKYPREAYLARAVKIHSWLKRALVNPSTGAVADNINGEGRISGRVFTYNQGTYIGTAYELYRITGIQSYLDDAVLSAQYVVWNMATNDGVLADAPGGDGGLFHGIFFRNFVKLLKEPSLKSDVRQELSDFIYRCANVLAQQGVNPRTGLYGGKWHQAPADDEPVSLTAHLSGCMRIEAVASLK